MTIQNRLPSDITDVNICYAESVKRKGFLYKLDWRSVDVESEKGVLWKRFLSAEAIPQGKEYASKGNIYFGKNRGYWQVYFTCEDRNYKINRKDAEMSLEMKDMDKTVLVDILKHDGGICVDFTIPSSSVKRNFLTQIGEPSESGVIIEIQNELAGEIFDICVIYTERVRQLFNKPDNEAMDKGFIRKHKLSKFNKVSGCNNRGIVENRMRSERLKFGCNESCWQLYFTYENHCYRLSNDPVVFNLGEDDNMQVLIISLSKKEKLAIEFRIGKKKEEQCRLVQK